MGVESPYLSDLVRYERTMHGWVDAPEEETFQITVRLHDPWVGLELVATTTPPPEYRVRAARGRVLLGPPERIDPSVGEALGALAGLTMTSGFTRKVADAVGARPGAVQAVDLAIEVARLARQVTRLPPGTVARHLPEGPLGAWRLDLAGWADLPASCYTYRPESEALFGARRVTTPIPPVLYHPPPGAQGVFTRTRVARLERREGEIVLTHSMFDEVHSFQVWCVIDAAAAVIVDAGSLTPRLPYAGICSDPQARVRDLVGQRVDAALRKRLGGIVGGPAGCAQLYDLVADLLRLLALP